MFVVGQWINSSAKWAVAMVSAVFVSACDPVNIGGVEIGMVGAGSGKVEVALLLPKSASSDVVRGLAIGAENAARMAVSDIGENAEITLRIYDTAGTPEQGALSATQAVAEGADVIVGPLFANVANAVGLATRDSDVKVLALSNNVDIAGGNVYVLGHTFQNAADRLVNYAYSQGKKRAMVIHGQTTAGQSGQSALMKALARTSMANMGSEGYEFSQQGVADAARRIAAAQRSNGADVVFITADFDGALAPLAQLLPEAGLNPATTQYAGITRWDSAPAAWNIPGIQGGWFTMPSGSRVAQFNQRYSNAFGSVPHIVSTVAYDGIAAAGALAVVGGEEAFSATSLTRANGFLGA